MYFSFYFQIVIAKKLNIPTTIPYINFFLLLKKQVARRLFGSNLLKQQNLFVSFCTQPVPFGYKNV